MNQVAMKKAVMRARLHNRQRRDQDIFHNTVGDTFNPYMPISTNLELDTSLGISSNSLSDYQTQQRQEEIIKEAEQKKKGSGDIISQIFGWVNQGLDTAQNLDKTIDAFKDDGTAVSSNGVDVNARLGDYPSEKPSMTKYYLIGGALMAVVIVGVVITKKRSN